MEKSTSPSVGEVSLNRNDGQAVSAIYIAVGLECAARLNKERYDELADTYGGNIGIMHEVARHSAYVSDVLQASDLEFPGVAEYEILHEFGLWLLGTMDKLSDEQIQLAFRFRFEKWVKAGNEQVSQPA